VSNRTTTFLAWGLAITALASVIVVYVTHLLPVGDSAVLEDSDSHSGTPSEGLSCQTNAGAEAAREFANLRHLRVLDIRGGISDLDAWFDAVCSLPNLQWLRLKYSAAWLRDDHLEPLGRLTELRYLYLGGCHELTDAAFAAISRCKKLEYLNLRTGGNQHVTDSGVANLAGMKLVELSLYGFEGITDDVFSSLGTLSRLEVLGLGGAISINGKKPATVSELPRLKRLSLFRCVSLEADALQALVKVTHELEVNVRSCPQITADVTSAIEARNPYITFIH
jgi:hypothetical protein